MNSEFTPTTGIVDTTKNVLGYMRGNFHVFWHFLKPYLLYMIGAHLVGLFLLSMGIPQVDPKTAGNPIGEMLALYFMMCFAITWYRVIIMGPQRVVAVNPFGLQSHEIRFLIFSVAIFFCFMLALLPGMVLTKLMPAAGLVLAAGMLVAAMWAGLRLAFYPPALAVDAGVSLNAAFALSKGFVWKIFSANFLVSIVIVIPIFLCSFVLGLVAIIFGSVGGPLGTILSGLVMMPLGVIVMPMATALTATILANYYLIAVRG